MTAAYFKHPTTWDKVANHLKYFNRSAHDKSLSEEQNSLVNELRKNGFAFIEGKIDPDTLEKLQRKTEEKLHEGDINFPILAQTKIDPIKHKKLLDQYLFGSKESFLQQGIAFEKKDFKNYDQVLKDFNPSTLDFFIPSDSPPFFQTWLHPFVLDVIEKYLGYRPMMFEAYVRRNFPSPHRTMNHFWHRDLNNKFLMVKSFIFLSDCELDNGPHEFISGTHNEYKLNGKVYYNDDEVNAVYPESSGRVIRRKVKAGTILLEDTRGLHRAALPERGHRDLGYAVFLPWPWYRNYKIVNYHINQETYHTLDPRQQQYILRNALT